VACGARTLLVSRHRSGVSHEMKRLSRRGMGLFGHSRRHRSCMSSLAGVFAGYSPVGWWVSFKPGNVGGKGGGGGGVRVQSLDIHLRWRVTFSFGAHLLAI
jgi:hypothetical protein